MNIEFDFETNADKVILTFVGIDRIEGLPRLSIRSESTGLYLGKKTWVKSSTLLPVEVISALTPVQFILANEVANRIERGDAVRVEESSSRFSAVVAWGGGEIKALEDELPSDNVIKLPLPVPQPTVTLLPPSPPATQNGRRFSLFLVLFVGIMIGGVAAWASLNHLATTKATGLAADMVATIAGEQQRLDQEKAALAADRAALEKQLAAAQSQSSGATDGAAQTQLAAFRIERDQLKRQAADNAQAVSELRQISDRRQTDLKQRQTEITALQADLANARSEVAQAKQSAVAMTSLQAQVDAYKGAGESKDAQIGELTRDRDRRQLTISSLDGQLNDAIKQKSDLEARLQAQGQTISQWSDERNSNTQKVQELQRQLALTANTATMSAAPVRTVWGAASLGKNGIVYTIQNQTEEKGASTIVDAVCQGKSGRNCERLTSYDNACFALARVDGQGAQINNWEFSVSPTWQEAEATATSRCQSSHGRSCTVRITACSPDTLSKPL